MISKDLCICNYCTRAAYMIVMIDKVGMLQMMCFMQEILRLGHKTSLYYPVYPSYTNEQVRY